MNYGIFSDKNIFIFSDKSYIVVDYCKRSLIEITPSDMMAQSPLKDSPGKNIILLTMLENHENKTLEMVTEKKL